MLAWPLGAALVGCFLVVYDQRESTSTVSEWNVWRLVGMTMFLGGMAVHVVARIWYGTLARCPRCHARLRPVRSEGPYRDLTCHGCGSKWRIDLATRWKPSEGS